MALPDAPQAVLPDLGETNSETPPTAPVRTPTMADLTDELTARRTQAHFGSNSSGR
ncbi:hypothetical protein [Streptomyces sp. NPDC058371]|uniref:hypothetical protein n=1 Tax=Streptomyces sp. NPDC058371 TaxID=3346463 RepID=UPI00366617C6